MSKRLKVVNGANQGSLELLLLTFCILEGVKARQMISELTHNSDLC